MRGAAFLVGSAFTAIVLATPSHAASHDIVQSERAFKPSSIEIARGDTLSFSNKDEFIHQIYIVNGIIFDSAEQEPGHTIQVNFPNAGIFEIRCHIHPKMLLTVHVK